MLSRLLAFMQAAVLTGSLSAAGVQIEATSPVTSPDGSRTVVVDHIMPVVGGEPDTYSGQLMIRVVGPDAKPLRQRLVEGSQVRIVNPPRWLDDTWCAFTYNISKNAQGAVYFNAANGRAIMLEAIATMRRMGATNEVLYELTHLELVEYGEETVRFVNLVRGAASLFPIRMSEVPRLGPEPPGKESLARIEKALSEYRQFCRNAGIPSVSLEQGSESFSPEGTAVATLACLDMSPGVLVVPAEEQINDSLDGVVVQRLEDSVVLTCAQSAPANGEPTDDESHYDPTTPSRYLTSWRDDQTISIEAETYAADVEEPTRRTLYTLTRQGKLERLDTATPVDSPTTAPE